MSSIEYRAWVRGHRWLLRLPIRGHEGAHRVGAGSEVLVLDECRDAGGQRWALIVSPGAQGWLPLEVLRPFPVGRSDWTRLLA